jgi:hypothetical protein
MELPPKMANVVFFKVENNIPKIAQKGIRQTPIY